jgi:hypothetical protein
MRGDPAEGRGVTLAVVAALFATIFIVRFAYGDAKDALTVLYVVPISVVAVRFGMKAGLAAAGLAMLLLAIWVIAEDPDIGAVGLVSRAVGFVVAAGLVGFLEERMRSAQARAHALAVHDDVLQDLMVARYALDEGDHDAVRAAIDQASEGARALVEAELPDKIEPGDLRR